MNKHAVEVTFGQAADHYDEAAHLQRKVADRLLAHTSNLSVSDNSHVVDLGTGTGYCLPYLQKHFSPKDLSALDISSAMLTVAGKRVPAVNLVQADLEVPPFGKNSIDLAVSSLAVQWLDDPEPFLSHMYDALKPGGYLALTSLGPKTLHELKYAWAQVDSSQHVNSFHAASDWHQAVEESGFDMHLWREEKIVEAYKAPIDLLKELKVLGANYVEREVKPRGTGLRKMLKSYELFRRDDNLFPATWDVFYLVLKKPD